jgi:phosphate transport system permease protein
MSVQAPRRLTGEHPSLRRRTPHARRRNAVSRVMTVVLLATVLAAVLPLALLLWQVVVRGAPALSWDFLTQIEPLSYRERGGGYLHGIIGTLYMTAVATVISVPLGLAAAVHLTEFTAKRYSHIVRFFTDVMTGVPSVFVGLFVYAALVVHLRFGTIMGATGLAIMMLPIVTRSSEEILRLVPEDQRAASAALGARKWQTITRVVLPTSAPGLTTGAMLAIARAAGETAVLMLTAFGSLQVVTRFSGVAQSSITLLIYGGAKNPFDPGKQRAWAGALVLMAMVFLLTLTARLITARTTRGRS